MTPVEWTTLIGVMGYSCLEYWLGRTDKVKAGSLLEAILLGAKSALRIVARKGEK